MGISSTLTYSKENVFPFSTEQINLSPLKLKVRRQESPDLTLEKVSVACGIPRPNSTVLRHHFVRAAASLAHPRWTPVNHDCV